MDKALHFGVSFGLTISGAALSVHFGATKEQAQIFGFVGAFVIGLLKELMWDLALSRGTPDPLDVVFNSYGCGLAVFVLTL